MKDLGAALIQENRPFAFASKVLTPTETICAHTDCEILAVVFGCQKFHSCLYGCNIPSTIGSDPQEKPDTGTTTFAVDDAAVAAI